MISVEAPSVVAAQDLDHPANADLLVNSAVNDFRCALVHFIGAGAYVGMEWGVGADLGGSSWVWYDNRVFEPFGWTAMYASGDCSGDAPSVYEPLSTARFMADDALRRLDEWGDQVPNNTELSATAAAFAGYSLTLLGESMCSAAIDLGPEMFPDELFAAAEDRFTRAIEAAGQVGDTDILNLARVGRARARLNLGRYSDAASDAGAVPDGFSYDFNYSSADASTENKLFVLMERELMATVDVPYRNMTFQGQPDPRLGVFNTGLLGPSTDIEMWATTKYSSLDSPVRVASWEEAQLIVAEAALEGNQLQEAVGIINTLHSRTNPPLPEFVSNNASEIRAQLIYERSAELFLEGQHMQDLERFNLELYPAPGTPAYHGGFFSDQICFPLPEVEYLNNPNISR
ncbi:MAG: RagB/SusD family nutrient uptake outer membrane protein [Longimicrobiales bacterium]|nr:RagB/SusD family nutrient uptake outer membrane protein [Longimicrobiales bacterium]